MTPPRSARFHPAIPQAELHALRTVASAARRSGVRVYLVGGAVRDALLGRSSLDLDVLVEGNALLLAETLLEREGGILHTHPRFATAAWTPAGGSTVHLAAARTESYPSHATLPNIAPGSLRDDLLRRDFTINALAVPLTKSGFGRVIDCFDGLADLQAKRLRVLHARSFLDDPTRAFRAARFAAELEFELAPETRQLVREAREAKVFALLSAARLRREIERALGGKSPLAVARAFAREGLLAVIDPALRPQRSTWTRLRNLQAAVAAHEATDPSERVSRWAMYLSVLAERLTSKERARLCLRLRPSRTDQEVIEHAGGAVRRLLARLARHARPRPSEVHAACRGANSEVVLLAIAAAKRPASRQALAQYLARLRRIRVAISGRDLIQAGIPEGPEVARRLARALGAKLDGEATNREEELSAALGMKGGKRNA